MSALKNIEKTNAQGLEALKRRQEREIKNMESSHHAYKTELKKFQSEDIVDLQEENNQQFAREAEKKEKVLSSMKEHLQNTKEMTDKQLKSLQENAAKDRSAVNERLILDRDRTVSENQNNLEAINHRFDRETKSVNHEGKTRVNDMTLAMNRQYAKEHGELQKKVNEQAMEFSARFKREGLANQILDDETKKQNKNVRVSTNLRQQGEMAKMTESHNNFMKAQDAENRKGLKEQDQFFEKRFETNYAAKTKDANNLDERFYDLTNKLKNDVAKEVTKTENRLSDPFYHFTELRPTWKKTEEGVEVKVTVPDYAKQDLQLTTNNKEAILSFNRRFTDTNSTGTGISNKVNKVESFTARIDTDTILNPKTVKSSYSDGVMTYTIKKT